METKEIRQYATLLRELDLTALEVRTDGTLRLERAIDPAYARPAFQAADIQKTTQNAQVDNANCSLVTSPMVGVVYVAPAENAEPFVQVGSVVHRGDILCIIEAMKLMNEITAERDGVVEEVLIVDGSVVEYGQSLFRLREEQS